MIGTPACSAVRAKPPRPNRCSRYRSLNGLPMPLKPSGNTPTSSPAASSRSRLGRIGPGVPAPPGQRRQHRHRVHQVGAEQAQVPGGRMLGEDARLQHDRVERQDAGVIGDDQGGPDGRHVLQPARPVPGTSSGTAPARPASAPPSSGRGRSRTGRPRSRHPAAAGRIRPPASRPRQPGDPVGGVAHRWPPQRQPAWLEPASRQAALLLVPALNPRLTQQLAVLLLRHPLAPLLDD